MTDKELALDILMLLSALESWAFSTGKPLPEHTCAELDRIIEALKGEVLK